MNSRAKGLTLLVVLGFVAFLLWSTLASQRVECAVSVEFRGPIGQRHRLRGLGGERDA